VLGVLLAGLVYWACSVAVLSFATYGDVHSDTTALPRLFELLLGERARVLVALVGYLACFASMNVYIQGFARRNGQGVPARALLLVVASCALCALLAAVLELSVDDLIRYANGNFVLIYLFSMAAGAVLLRGVWRWLAGLATLLCAAVLAMLGGDALYALVLLGLLLLLDQLRAARRSLA
jgi:amino acid efflux transporter